MLSVHLNFSPDTRQANKYGQSKVAKGVRIKRVVKALPFSCSKEYAHPDVPGQWTDLTVIVVQPLVQITVLHVLVNKHPDNVATAVI